jgi:TetR/AcrR family transcriptional regulator, transcriptional repressor for nem operon
MGRAKEFNEYEVLQKATQIFWSKGYQGTSIDDLTKELGISRSSLYDTYRGKKALLMNVLKNYSTQATSNLKKIKEQNISGRQKIQTLIAQSIEAFQIDPQKKGCLIVNISTELGNQDGDVLLFSQKNLETVKSIFQEIILEGQQDGSISANISAEDLAYFLFNTYNGIQVSGKMGASQDVLRRMWTVAETMLD